jgi:hypothetical protein
MSHGVLSQNKVAMASPHVLRMEMEMGIEIELKMCFDRKPHVQHFLRWTDPYPLDGIVLVYIGMCVQS